MNCKKARTLLSRYFDGDVLESERRLVGEHLRECAQCSQVLEDFKKLRQLLMLKEQRTMKPLLWSRIAAELRGGGIEQSWIAQIHTPWLGRAAAFILGFVLIGSLLFIGLKIIPNGHAESTNLAELEAVPTVGTITPAPDFASNNNRDHGQLTKDSVLSIILYDNDNGKTENK